MTTKSRPAAPTPEVVLEGGHRLVLRPGALEDAGGLLAFGSGPRLRYLCNGPENAGCGACGPEAKHALPAFVATDEQGAIVGAAWLDVASHATEQAPARLAIAVQAMYQHTSVPVELLRLVAEESRQRRIERLVTCVSGLGRDPFAAFRSAGLRVVSSLGVGGVTEVVLAAPA